MRLRGRGVVGDSGLLRRLEVPQEVLSPIQADSRPKGAVVGVPRDTSVAGRAVAAKPSVALVLGACGGAQVGASVVEAVAVDVVNLNTSRDSKKESVHVESDVTVATTDAAVGIPKCGRRELRAPRERRDDSEVGLVYNRGQSLRQRDAGNAAIDYDRGAGLRAHTRISEVGGVGFRPAPPAHSSAGGS